MNGFEISYFEANADIRPYQLEAAISGNCSSVVKCSCCKSNGIVCLSYNIDGLKSAVTSLEKSIEKGSFNMGTNMRALFAFLCEVCLAAIESEDFLIEPDLLSLEPEHIYCEERGMRLIVRPFRMDFCASFIVLCRSLEEKMTGKNNTFLSDYLKKKSDGGCCSPRVFLNVLYALETDMFR